MPENRKETKNCHDCGLESLGDCEERSVHRPVDEKSPPCSCCVRNPEKSQLKTLWRADFYSEMWTLTLGTDKHWSPEIEDPDPHERSILEIFHKIINEGGGRNGKEQKP